MNIFGGNDIQKEAQKMTDCNYVMSEYILNKYFAYRYRDVLAFIVAALIVPAFFKYFKMKNGSYFRTYLFLFAILFIVRFVITLIVKQMLPSDALHKLLVRCEGWQTDEKNAANCKSVIDPEAASHYLKEGFENPHTGPIGPPRQRDNIGKSLDAVGNPVIREEEKKDEHGRPVATGVADMEAVDEPAASNEVSEAFSNPFLTGTPVCKDMYAPLDSKCAPGCMKDDNMRKTACLGLEPTSDINYPGGGAYQVQSAATVQNRLSQGNYVPENCLAILQ